MDYIHINMSICNNLSLMLITVFIILALYFSEISILLHSYPNGSVPKHPLIFHFKTLLEVNIRKIDCQKNCQKINFHSLHFYYLKSSYK